MITDKLNIRMDSVFSDDRTHRYLLRRSWAREGKIATIIMVNPSSAQCLITDQTSMSVYNGLGRLEGYSSLNIVNLYSLITPKLNFRWHSEEELTNEDNDKAIIKAANEADQIILAWGSIAENNLRAKRRVLKVMELLKKDKDMLTSLIRVTSF